VRVIAGKYRNRNLKTSNHFRPTTDRVRETLFNILQSEIENSVFVDAFAGSGAVGIEALSRGAHSVYFIENNRRVLSILESNVTQLGSDANWRIYSVTAMKGLEVVAQNGTIADLIFFDPPYESDQYAELVDTAVKLFPDATIIVECSSRSKWRAPDSVQLKKSREIGETVLQFYGKSLP